MPVAGKADVVIDKTTIASSGRVTVTTGDATHTQIDIQDVYDACREWEDDLENLDVPTSVPTGRPDGLLSASGKEGIGLGDQKPPTVVAEAITDLKATAGAGPATRIFTYSGGTLISDEEAADAADPRSPLIAAGGFVEYDRTKGQEGKLLNEADLERLRKWVTNAQRLAEGTTGNFEMWDDGADPDVDPPLETQDVTDKDGNAIVLPTGAPARRSEAT